MSKTILVADDNRSLVLLMEAKLTDNQYSVITAKNGEEAMEKAGKFKPDLIILDVQMPHMDGDEVYMHLKSDEATKHIPIFIMTGLRSEKEILENGEENVFSKPVDFDRLFAKIKEAIGE